MIIGYVRLSEHEQQADLAAQRGALLAFGAEKVFTGTSTPNGPQEGRDAAVAFVREGDTLVVARPDRLARNPAQLLRIADGLSKRGGRLVVLSGLGPPLDTLDRACEPMLTHLRGVAAWDKTCRLELQRVGIRRAQREGKYKGGKQRVSSVAIQSLAADGMRPSQIARILRISRNTVYTYLPPDYRTPRKPKRLPRGPIDGRAIAALLAAGAGPTRIAASLGCSRRSVYRLGYGT